MIRLYRPAPDGAGLQMQEGLAPALDDAVVWIDLLSPEPGEKARLEALLGFAIPSLEEMRERPATFILKDQRLIAIRYHQPRAFDAIARRIIRLGREYDSGVAMVVALLEPLSWMVFKEDRRAHRAAGSKACCAVSGRWMMRCPKPPTLIASLCGMNFRFMPELSWPWGYPSRWGRWSVGPYALSLFPLSRLAVASGAVAVVVAAAFVARKSFETSQIRLGLAPVLVYIGPQGVTGREKHEP